MMQRCTTSTQTDNCNVCQL